MNKIKKIIIIIVLLVVIILAGMKIYEIIDDMIWDSKFKDSDIYDNLLNVECKLDEEDSSILSCTINTKEKTSAYETLSVHIEHYNDIKYLEHTIPSNKGIYNSHETVEYKLENVKESFYINGFDELDDLDYLLNIKFKLLDGYETGEILKFKYMSLNKDYVYHYTNDIVISMDDVIKR